MQVAGYILTPCVDKDGNVVATDFTSISCVDMGGKMTKKVRNLANKIKARGAVKNLKTICDKIPAAELATYGKYISFQSQVELKTASGSPDGTQVSASDVAVEDLDMAALTVEAGGNDEEAAPADNDNA